MFNITKSILLTLLLLIPLIINAQVSQQWATRYNSSANAYDEATWIVTDGSGNVYVTGGSTGTGTGRDFYTVKYNSAGIQQWVYRYNGTANNNDEIYSTAIDASGNVYITGYSNGTNTGADFVTIKLNSSGQQLWLQRYDGPIQNDDYGNAVVLDGNNVYIIGSSTSINDLDYTIIKYNSDGVQQWLTRYNGPANGIDDAISGVVDGSGNLYVTGYSHGSGSNSDAVTIKLNSSGVIQWNSRYNGPANGIDQTFGIQIDNQSNIYVIGNSAGTGTMDDYLTIKYNSAGVQQWVARYDGTTNDDYANALAIDVMGNVFVTGLSWGGASLEDYATVKYNSSGVQQWAIRYNGPGNEYDDANALVLDPSGAIIISGGSDNANNTDYCTIKYTETIGIKHIGISVPANFKLYNNYPNPFNPSTKIKFDIAQETDIRISIFDASGRMITEYSQPALQPGSYEYTFEGSRLGSGIYFYKLSAGNFSETKKMMLIK